MKKAFLVCAALALGAMAPGEAFARKRKLKPLAKISSGKREAKRRTLRSSGDARERAEILDEAGLYHAALYERIQNARSGGSERELEKIGNSALALDRLELVNALSSALHRTPSKFPASYRMAMAGFAMRSKAVSVANQWLPDMNSLASISEPTARIKAALAMSSIQASQGQTQRAMDALSAVPESHDPIKGGVLHLQRARIDYNENHLTEALAELQRVTRQSSSWYPGVMVAAWSAYRVKDYNLALGQLMTLHSPHLAGKFNPESYTLQAAALFRLCYFESAATTLAQLRSRYDKILSSIDRFRRQYDNKYSMVSTVINYARGDAGDAGAYPEGHYDYIMDGLLSSEPMSEVDRSLTQIKQEEKIMDESADSISAQMRSLYKRELEAARKEYYRKGLRAAATKLSLMRREASEALENALAIEVEINTRVRERLITGQSARIKDIDFDAEIKKGYEFWPFQGEYWQDEVGGYAFATSDVCGDQGS